jgi:PAS domain S-box-containing protein
VSDAGHTPASANVVAAAAVASSGPAADSTHALYRSLFAAYPDALLLVDASGHIVLSNPEASRLLGYGADELNGLPVDTLVPDAIRPRHAAFRGAYGQQPRARPMGGPAA